MGNSIASTKNYTTILDEVYQRAAVSACLNSPRRMVRAGRNAKEIMVPKIQVSGLGNYTRNVGYKTGSITYEFETKTFNYDRGIRLLADVMDVEEAGMLDCFVEAGSELQRTQVAPEADAFTFAEIAAPANQRMDRDGADARSRYATPPNAMRGSSGLEAALPADFYPASFGQRRVNLSNLAVLRYWVHLFGSAANIDEDTVNRSAFPREASSSPPA